MTTPNTTGTCWFLSQVGATTQFFFKSTYKTFLLQDVHLYENTQFYILNTKQVRFDLVNIQNMWLPYPTPYYNSLHKYHNYDWIDGYDYYWSKWDLVK